MSRREPSESNLRCCAMIRMINNHEFRLSPGLILLLLCLQQVINFPHLVCSLVLASATDSRWFRAARLFVSCFPSIGNVLRFR